MRTLVVLGITAVVGVTFGVAEAPQPPVNYNYNITLHEFLDRRTPVERRADFCLAALLAGDRCM